MLFERGFPFVFKAQYPCKYSRWLFRLVFPARMGNYSACPIESTHRSGLFRSVSEMCEVKALLDLENSVDTFSGNVASVILIEQKWRVLTVVDNDIYLLT